MAENFYVADQRIVNSEFARIWRVHVPEFGGCADLRYEVIRVTGRIGNEILNNGSINWDDDFEQMLASLKQYFEAGVTLSYDDLLTAQGAAESLTDGRFNADAIDTLTRYAVIWYTKNPDPIPITDRPYTR